ncbi:MAG TPA: hypothetical protein DEB40_14565 [Elusimicrobia bacterium]|nr:hypothetical protein [Elusimicrobiota bacterium]HBT62957.1 hypothetical protein [Elusimicrobiota bacterium]
MAHPRRDFWLRAAAVLLLRGVPACALDRDQYFYSDIFTPFFSAEPAAGGKTLFKTRRPGSAAGQEFVEPKPENTTRVFVVGGSIANVFLSVRREPEVRLDRVLARAFPGRSFEVIDCGMSGYDSYRESLVLEEVLARRPDAVIVMTGNNEAYGEGQVNRLLRGVFRGLSRSAAFRALRGRFIRKLAAHGPRMPDNSQLARARWLEAFEGNLRGMARAAKSAGIPIVLCALPVNFQDIPPEGELPLDDIDFLRGFEALARADVPAALAHLRRHARAAPQEPFGRYYAAKSWEALGGYKQARASYWAALERDRLVRCSPSANNVIRRVAREEGAALADIEAAFLSAAPRGLLGREMFLDDVHWHLECNRLADRAVLSALLALAQEGWTGLGPRDAWNAAAIKAAESFCAADRVRLDPELRRQIDEKRLLYAVGAVLDSRALRASRGGPRRFSERALAFFDMILSGDKETVLRLGRRKDSLSGKLEANIWSEQRARDFEAAWPEVLMHAGESLRRRRLYREAVSLFDQALALAPALRRARVFRAAAFGALRRKQRALADLEPLASDAGLPEARFFFDEMARPGKL